MLNITTWNWWAILQLLIQRVQDVSSRGSLSTVTWSCSSWQRATARNVLHPLDKKLQYCSLVSCCIYRRSYEPLLNHVEHWCTSLYFLPQMATLLLSDCLQSPTAAQVPEGVSFSASHSETRGSVHGWVCVMYFTCNSLTLCVPHAGEDITSLASTCSGFKWDDDTPEGVLGPNIILYKI